MPCRNGLAKQEDLAMWSNHQFLFFDQNQEFIIFSEQNRTLFCINISGHSQVAYEKKVYVYLVQWLLGSVITDMVFSLRFSVTFGSISSQRPVFSNSAIKVHNSYSYRNMDMTREHISFISDPKDICYLSISASALPELQWLVQS